MDSERLARLFADEPEMHLAAKMELVDNSADAGNSCYGMASPGSVSMLQLRIVPEAREMGINYGYLTSCILSDSDAMGRQSIYLEFTTMMSVRIIGTRLYPVFQGILSRSISWLCVVSEENALVETTSIVEINPSRSR